jgi:hypothetical protein
LTRRFENGSTTKYYYSGSAILFMTGFNNNLLTENILDPGDSTTAIIRQRILTDWRPHDDESGLSPERF